MKALNTVLKIFAALAVIAGIIFVVAAYGDKIVSWAKKATRTIRNTFRKAPVELYEEETEAEESDFEA